MKIPPVLRSGLRLSIGLAAFPALVHAHPGHDGHELTWDLGHLAAHPLATLLWTAIFSAGLWSLGKLASASVEALRLASVRRKARQ